MSCWDKSTLRTIKSLFIVFKEDIVEGTKKQNEEKKSQKNSKQEGTVSFLIHPSVHLYCDE